MCIRDSLRIWLEIGETLIFLWDVVKNNLIQTWDFISAVAQDVWGFLARFWDNWGNLILTIFGTTWDQIKLTVETAINLVKDTILFVLAIIRGDWEAAWDALKDFVTTTWDFISSTLSNIWDGMKNAAKDAWDGVVKVVKGAINGIIGFINKLIGAWNSLGFSFPGVEIMGKKKMCIRDRV